MKDLPRQRAALSLRSVSAGCVFAIGVVWVLAWLLVAQLRAVETEAASREVSAFAALLADHTDRTLQGVDLLLTLLVSRVEVALGEGTRDPDHLHGILSAGLAGLPQVRRVVLLGEDGTARADSEIRTAPQFNSADRPHYRVHRERADVGLYISDPLQSRVDHQWSIILSRRVNARDGGFGGIIAALVDPQYLGNLFRSAGLPEHTRVALLKRNGVMLAQTGTANAGSTGARIPRAFFDYEAPDLPARGPMPGRSVLGDDRIGFYATGASYPFIVAASRPLRIVASASRRSEVVVFGAALIVTVAILLVAMMFMQRLRSLEVSFREGIERMGDGFMLWDAEDRLIAWNTRADEILRNMAPFRRPGIRFEDYIRAGAVEVFRHLTPEEARASVAFRIARFRDAGAAWEFCDDGERIVEVEEGRTGSGGTVSIYRDVTVRRRQQEEVEKALTAERAANLVHRRFIAMASHEFRTPLAVIDGAAQRVLDQRGSEGAKTADRMKRIRDAVSRMTSLIDRMLSSARLDEGRITVDAQSVDLSALLRDVVGLQRQISAGFVIELSLPDRPLLIRGDAQLLEQVFSNLLSNAVKYSGSARRVDVDAALLDTAGGTVDVSVTDGGIGVPADEIDQLFTRFFRARTANGISGTGIGLHLAREFVRLHGGTMAVRSTLGEGTTFTVHLPTRGLAAEVRDAA